MKSSAHHDALAAVPIFAELSKRQRGRLLDAARVVEYPAGREVATEGEGALALHVVLEGTASVSVGGNEKRLLVTGDYFGEISLIDGRPRSATVTAVEPLTTLTVSRPTFQALLEAEPACARQIMTVLCARLREAESHG